MVSKIWGLILYLISEPDTYLYEPEDEQMSQDIQNLEVEHLEKCLKL